MVIYLERGADLHMAQLMLLPLTVSCFSKIQIGFTFLVLAHLGSPGKRAVKQVCVVNQLFMALNTACCCVVEKLLTLSLTPNWLITWSLKQRTFFTFLKPFNVYFKIHRHTTNRFVSLGRVGRSELGTTDYHQGLIFFLFFFCLLVSCTRLSWLNSWPTFSPYLYNRVWSELTCRNSMSHSRLACSRLSAHIQPSVNNPDRLRMALQNC